MLNASWLDVSHLLDFFDDAQLALVVPVLGEVFEVADPLGNTHRRSRVRLCLVLHVFQIGVEVQTTREKKKVKENSSSLCTYLHFLLRFLDKKKLNTKNQGCQDDH